ncbi:hypothetical protein F0562_015084 [Nyssa sinensis]|uniref:Bromo domain-containing protein n=1 Tax=Nyssa sinensis TaxID=561372 RepID=A0A5J4ZGE6_9ASTE|nr:hypothetical protein F0562_015084 [Nyssa sinensis]
MSKKMQMSMWRDEHRRRSPRISALDAWKAHQPIPFSSQRVRVMEHQDSGSGDDNGPPSRPRARIKRKPENVGMQSPNDEVHSTNSDQPLVLKAKETPKHDGHATCIGQQLVASSVPWMPEKRILELILDILQRRDTNEIFAEPVDPDEVEDYYEIIKEPMDFGTMRAKLHEGMYKSLEQFEHDVFLISRNAMHFNSSATIYFRQARAIQELAKKVFHVLKTDPENFELEFSGARRRSGRRPQGEGKGCHRFATNVRYGGLTIDVSSKGAPCSLSGPSCSRRSIRGTPGLPSTITHADTRDYDFSSGARDVKRSNFAEADRRCTYRPWMSFHNENDSIVSTIYNDPKPLKLVNQGDISYRESLMLFVKDLGPTVQKIAKRRLQGWGEDDPNCQTHSNSGIQVPKCHIPTAFANAHRVPSTVDTMDTVITNASPEFLDPLPGCRPVLKTPSSDIIDLTDADDGEKAYTSDRMGNHRPQEGAIASKNEGSTTHNGMNVFGVSRRDKVFQNRSTDIHSSSYPSAAAATGDLSSSVFGVNKSTAMTVDVAKLKNQVAPAMLSLEHSQANVFEVKLRNNNSSPSSSRPLHTRVASSLCQTNGSVHRHQAITTLESKDEVSNSSQAVHSSVLNHVPSVSRFAFDLPFFKSRLNQMNLSDQDRSLQHRFQQGSGSEGLSFDQMRQKRAFNSTQPAELSTQPFLNNQQRT